MLKYLVVIGLIFAVFTVMFFSSYLLLRELLAVG